MQNRIVAFPWIRVSASAYAESLARPITCNVVLQYGRIPG
jgi:hypothetical protein